MLCIIFELWTSACCSLGCVDVVEIVSKRLANGNPRRVSHVAVPLPQH